LGFPDSGSKLGKAGGGPPAFTEAEALEGTSGGSTATGGTGKVPAFDKASGTGKGAPLDKASGTGTGAPLDKASGTTAEALDKASGTGGGTAFNGTASEEDFDGTASSAASAIRLHVCH